MKTFKDLGVNKGFVKGLTEMGIVNPTEIQELVIPMLLNFETDMVGKAQTGTGKTAAFGLPLLHKIDPNKDHIQGLILSPTRELGQQIAKQLFKFTKYSDKIFTEAIFGGQHIDIQIEKLNRPTQILVATPGRLIDLINRKVVDLSAVHTVIMDEADEMLSMGFKKELDEILGHVSSVKSKWLFSATMPEGIRQIVNTHLSPDAKRIEASGSELNKNITHQYVVCDDAEKLHVLLQFLKSEHKNRGLVFCKTKKATQLLAKQLEAKNISSGAIHGDLLQKERDKVMRAFKNESIRMLVATDLAARGLDVADLAFVVHYELPDKEEYFTHRSGRTARGGKEGVSLSIVNSKELKSLRFFEKKLQIPFQQIRAQK